MDAKDKASQNDNAAGSGSSPAPQVVEESIKSVKTNETKAEQQLAEVEREMSGFEKATLHWAKTAVIMSALAAIFVCAQWWEMHKAGVDTRKLVDAAGAQAKAADQAVKTSNRPWIGLVGDVTLRPRDSFTEAIEKENRTPTKVSPPIAMIFLPFYEMTVQNFGSSPALDVSTEIQPFMPSNVPFEKWVSDFNEVTKTLCQDLYNPPGKPGKWGTDSGQTIFPGKTGIQEIGGGIYGSVIDGISNSARSTEPQIIGCIRYKDQLGNVHHTRFCVEGKDWKSHLRPCGMGEYAD